MLIETTGERCCRSVRMGYCMATTIAAPAFRKHAARLVKGVYLTRPYRVAQAHRR